MIRKNPTHTLGTRKCCLIPRQVCPFGNCSKLLSPRTRELQWPKCINTKITFRNPKYTGIFSVRTPTAISDQFVRSHSRAA